MISVICFRAVNPESLIERDTSVADAFSDAGV